MEVSEQILVSISDSSELLGISRSKLYILISSAQVPAQVNVGGRKMFRTADLKKWASMGCPSRERFEKAIEVGAENG